MFDLDGRPIHVTWRYSRSEIVVDGIVHGIGLVLALAGAGALLALAAYRLTGPEIASVIVYVVGLISLLSVSAAYNLWPISRTKWWLRRFDHASIFILIAATYTPFMIREPPEPAASLLFAAVWTVAIVGAVVKVILPGRFDRAAIVAYLLLGLSGVVVWDSVANVLSPSTMTLMVSGGLCYAAGVAFHVWDSLRYQNAVWHSFVLVASALFYSAILTGVVLA